VIHHLLLVILLFPSSPGGSSSLEAADREFHGLRYVSALALYDSALTTSADSAAVLWRMARAWICLADTTAPDRKYHLYQKAESCALRAVAADSTCSQAHAWLAAAIGNIAMFEGGKTKVRLAHTIKREVDRAIALDATNDVAYSILGSFHKAIGDVSWIEKQLANIFLGGLPDGGYAESEAAFRRAIELAPGVPRNHYELAKVYLCLDRNAEALLELRRTRTLPATVAHDVELQRSTAELIRELEE
jgi:tetratricopeptide (TPR) repeat protein